MSSISHGARPAGGDGPARYVSPRRLARACRLAATTYVVRNKQTRSRVALARDYY